MYVGSAVYYFISGNEIRVFLIHIVYLIFYDSIISIRNEYLAYTRFLYLS